MINGLNGEKTCLLKNNMSTKENSHNHCPIPFGLKTVIVGLFKGPFTYTFRSTCQCLGVLLKNTTCYNS